MAFESAFGFVPLRETELGGVSHELRTLKRPCWGPSEGDSVLKVTDCRGLNVVNRIGDGI